MFDWAVSTRRENLFNQHGMQENNGVLILASGCLLDQGKFD